MSVIVSIPVISPAAEGVNVTVMMQLAPATRLVPQLLVSENAAGVIAMPVMFRAALPVLVRVTVCAALVVPTT